MTGEDAAPASPCISVCALDENDICMGCFRSDEEITDWFTADPARKREILQLAAQRRDAAHQVRLG